MVGVGNATNSQSAIPSSDLESGPEDSNLIHPPPTRPHHEVIPEPLSPTPTVTEDSTTNEVPIPDYHPTKPEWYTLIVTFSFGAMSVSIQSLPSTKPPPISLHLAGLGLVLALASILISKYIPVAELGREVKQMLENAGVFFGVTSFLMAITLSFPLWLNLVSWAIYTVALLTIFYYPIRKYFF